MSKAKVLSLVAILSLLVIGISAYPLLAVDAGYASDEDIISAGARCCLYASHCAQDKCCLHANPNEADCSQNRPHYCRDCPIAIEQ